MSLPRRHNFFDTLAPAFHAIREDCLIVVNGTARRYSRWSYKRLARLYGEPYDWASGGYVRSHMAGWENRDALMARWGLWWTADMETHEAILFTCCPELGTEWMRVQNASAIESRVRIMEVSCKHGERLRPTRKAWFRQNQKKNEQIMRGVDGLRALEGTSFLRLLPAQVESEDDR